MFLGWLGDGFSLGETILMFKDQYLRGDALGVK